MKGGGTTTLWVDNVSIVRTSQRPFLFGQGRTTETCIHYLLLGSCGGMRSFGVSLAMLRAAHHPPGFAKNISFPLSYSASPSLLASPPVLNGGEFIAR